MTEILNGIVSFFQQAVVVISSFRFVDFLDILLVALIAYGIIRLVRETRAMQLFKGIVFFAIMYVIIKLLDMQASSYIFHGVAANAFVCLAVIFSPEIRHVLESFGRSSTSLFSALSYTFSSRQEQSEKIDAMITEVCRASSNMSDKKIGALMVFEKNTMLGSVVATGTPIDAGVTEELIGTVFFPKTPLHDGAAVFRMDRMVAAGCILPLTKNNSLSKELGTRHRAALGLSEECDAVIVVVSEETGSISVVEKGRINRGVTPAQLREILRDALILEEESKRSRIFGKLVNSKKRGE